MIDKSQLVSSPEGSIANEHINKEGTTEDLSNKAVPGPVLDQESATVLLSFFELLDQWDHERKEQS